MGVLPMIAAFAIALPIILAVMGVVMGLVMLLSPPSPIFIWSCVAAFAVLGLVAIGVSIKDRHNVDAAQEELKTIIKGLQDSIDKMTKPVTAPTAQLARDPDALYQNESGVGKVIGARITLNESKVYFEQIENAGHLDTNKNFEYRDYILRFVRADAYIGMLVQAPGGIATNVYQRVVCEIVGRVH
jgi:hypothetical protein